MSKPRVLPTNPRTAMSLFCQVSVATLPFRVARSPPARLQPGAQRVTFGGSHQFSSLISFSSTWALSAITPSSNLVSLLESEIQSSIVNVDAPNNDEVSSILLSAIFPLSLSLMCFESLYVY